MSASVTSVVSGKDWRSEWQHFGEAIYLDTAAHAAFPKSTIAAVEASLAAKAMPHTMDEALYFEAPTRIRRALAQLLEARPEEIALTTGASSGLELLALSLKWKPGDEVITAAGEFPTQYSTWKPMEARKGLQLKIVAPRDRFLTATDLIEAITPRTRVISVSHVRFDDGTVLETASIADACRARGILFALDVSQSCGAIPLNVRELGADLIVCAGYKWLLGPSGSGFAWISRALLESMRPAPFYWAAQTKAEFSSLNLIQPEPSTDARRRDYAESATYFNLNLSAMASSVELVVKIGPRNVLDHGRGLIKRLYDHLPSGFHPASPIEDANRGSFGCFVASTPEETLKVRQQLKSRQIIVSLREGRIRVSPYLFNTVEDIDTLISTLAR